MKHLKCCDCGSILHTPNELRMNRCTACQYVQAHIDLAACVIGVPTRALRAAERTEAKAS